MLSSKNVYGLGRVMPCLIAIVLTTAAKGQLPVPLLTSLSPASAQATLIQFPLTIYGSGIVPGQTDVYWDGYELNAPVCSAPAPPASAKCVVTVAGFTNWAQTAEINLFNPGVGYSNSVYIPVTWPTTNVTARPSDIPSTFPYLVATGDFNDDGYLDFVVTSTCPEPQGYTGGSQTCLVVWLGDGKGGFTQASSTRISISTNTLLTADFNHDGILDVATLNNDFPENVKVLFGDGNGGFSSSTQFSPSSSGATGLATGDFNGDGNLDFVTVNSTTQTMQVFLANGHGGYSSLPETWVFAGEHVAVVTADFNSDGKLDLAVLDSDPYQIYIMLGDGSGNFTVLHNFATAAASDPGTIILSDFNNDGIPDLAVSGLAGGVDVFLGDGAGGFVLSASTSVGSNASLAAADLNGDGNIDLAGTAGAYPIAGSGQVTVLLGDGKGGFTTNASVTVGTDPRSIAMADFNGDGRMDFVTVNGFDNMISVLLQVPSASISPPGLTLPNTTPGSVSTVQTITLNNTGSATLNVTGFGITGPFQVAAGGSCKTTPFLIAAESNCTVNVAFAPTTLGAATGQLTFTASDPNFGNSTVTTTLSGTASQIAPTVTFTGAPASALYGSNFTVAATTNASTSPVITAGGACSISGNLVTMTSGTGTCSLQANWAADSTYLAASANQSTVAVKITATVTWNAPANISSGTSLSSTQLDATASVPGTFVYTPSSGTILGPGTQTLSVTFTPSSSADYTTVIATVPITVNASGNLTITSGNYTFSGGTISGNVTMSGGSLVLTNSVINGNFQVSGGAVTTSGSTTIGGNMQISGNSTFSIGPSMTIGGNLQIQTIAAGPGENQVCGATVKGNLQVQGSASSVEIGGFSMCAGNAISGNLQVTNNTAQTQVVGNTVKGNLQDNNNSAGPEIFNNVISGSLQCQNDFPFVVTGGNTYSSAQGQCAPGY